MRLSVGKRPTLIKVVTTPAGTGLLPIGPFRLGPCVSTAPADLRDKICEPHRVVSIRKAGRELSPIAGPMVFFNAGSVAGG